MRSLLKYTLALTLPFTSLGCSVNILETFANKTTNEALYVDAQSLTDKGDYSGALADIAKMKGTYASTTKVIELEASAYAGRCGLNFLTLVNNLSSMNGARLFPYLLSKFDSGTTTSIDDCISAQTLLQSLGTVATRSLNDSMDLALTEFAKIGVILSFYADPTATGTRTSGYNPCVVGVAPRAAGSAITDADAAEIGVAISLIIENLTALASKVNLGSGSLTNISGLCTALNSVSPIYNFCNTTNAATMAANANYMLAIRSLILEGSVMGLDGGACNGGNITSGACRCF